MKRVAIITKHNSKFVILLREWYSTEPDIVLVRSLPLLPFRVVQAWMNIMIWPWTSGVPSQISVASLKLPDESTYTCVKRTDCERIGILPAQHCHHQNVGQVWRGPTAISDGHCRTRWQAIPAVMWIVDIKMSISLVVSWHEIDLWLVFVRAEAVICPL